MAHAVKPRSFRQKMSKKARRTALKSALLAKLRAGEIKVVTDLDFAAPKTKEAASVLKGLGALKSCLVVVREQNETAYKSMRNLPSVDIMTLGDLNAYAALLRKTVVLTKDALEAIPQEMK